MTTTAENDNLFQLTGVGVVQTDMVTGRFVRANEAFCGMVGYSEAELQEMTNAELTHPEDWERDGKRFAALQRGELHEDTAVTRMLHKDGREVWLELNITLLEEGSQAGNIAIVNDVTERKRTEANLAFIAALNEDFASLSGADEIMMRVGERLARHLGLSRFVFSEVDDKADRITALYEWQRGEGTPSVLGSYAISALLTEVGRRHYAAGKLTVIPDTRDNAMLAAPPDLLFAGGNAAIVDAPYLDHGRWKALLTAVRSEPGVWREDETALLEDLAARLYLRIERARAEAALRESDERHAFLLTLSDALRRETSVEAVGNRAVGMIAKRLGLDRVYLVAVTPGDDNIVVTHEVRRADMPPLLGSYRGSDFPDAMRQIFEQTIVYGDVRTDPRLGELDRRSLAGLGAVGFIAAPILRGEGEMIWAGGGLSAQPRSWSANEVALFEDAIERAWMAVERVRAEAALRQSEEHLRLATEAALMYSWTLDLKTQATTYSANTKSLTGFEPPTTFAQAQELIHPEDRVLLARVFEEAMMSRDRFSLEVRAPEDDGQDVWFLVSGAVIFGVDGEPSQVIGTSQSITSRKRAEEEREMLLEAVQDFNAALEKRVHERTEELERSNTRFTQAFTLAPFPALISTLDKHETFLEVNDAFLEFTRYKREEIIGQQAFDLKMWSSTHDQKKLAEAQKDGRGFRNLPLQLKDSEGNLLDVLLSAEVIRIDGHHGYLKMFYDVTEQKRSDEQMALAVNSLFAEASWFSQEFVARLNYIRSGGIIEDYQPLALSPREREVLLMIARGWTNKRISEELGLKQQTIRNYLSNIFEKIGVHSRTEAAVWARERGLIA